MRLGNADHDSSIRDATRRLATYAQRIKNKTGTPRKASARAAAPKAEPAAAPSAASGELQQLRDELQRVNREISKLARVVRPGSEHSQLPEKQELLVQKVDLERKIRAASKA